MDSKANAIKSGSWITFSTILQTALQFIQISILARLLSPADFGIVAISNTVIIFFSLFANLGFSNSIISKQENDKKVLSSIYFLGIGLGIVVFLLAFYSSPLIVGFYGEPRLSKVIKIASCVFLVDYFGSVYSALLQKELKFKSIAIIDIAGYLIGVSLTITFAYKGYKELALVYGGLAGEVCRTALRIILGRKLFFPTLNFNWLQVKEHLKFGIYNFGEGILGFIQSNWDNIMIGKLLGTQLLGYYTLAYQLAIFPIIKINPIVLQIAYPILAKLKNNMRELKKSYIKVLDLITFFNFPLLAGLLVTAEGVVPLIYGPHWEATFPLIKIFVFISVASCLSHPLFTLVYTKEKPNLLFYLNILTLLVKIPLVYLLGKYWGITGIAYAFLIATIINTIFSFIIARSLIGSFVKQFFKSIYKQVVFCLLLISFVSFYKLYAGSASVLHIAIEIAIGGLVYIGLSLRYKYAVFDLKNLKT